jgi:hypothetical protein
LITLLIFLGCSLNRSVWYHNAPPPYYETRAMQILFDAYKCNYNSQLKMCVTFNFKFIGQNEYIDCVNNKFIHWTIFFLEGAKNTISINDNKKLWWVKHFSVFIKQKNSCVYEFMITLPFHLCTKKRFFFFLSKYFFCHKI